MTQAGWYPLDGEIRYWNGEAWTDEVRPRLSATERAARLDAEIASASQPGNTSVDVTVAKTGEWSALVTIRPKTNHLLHFLIGVFTCGTWWLVWLLIYLTTSSKAAQRVLTIDEWGRAEWATQAPGSSH